MLVAASGGEGSSRPIRVDNSLSVGAAEHTWYRDPDGRKESPEFSAMDRPYPRRGNPEGRRTQPSFLVVRDKAQPRAAKVLRGPITERSIEVDLSIGHQRSTFGHDRPGEGVFSRGLVLREVDFGQ